jgi:hypothetical protein
MMFCSSSLGWIVRATKEKDFRAKRNIRHTSSSSRSSQTTTDTLSKIRMAFRSPIRQTLALIAIASCMHVVECGAASRRRAEQEELDKQRYRQPFAIIFFSIFLAVSLPLARFFHCILTDPLMPQLYKELKKRAAGILRKRFGNIGDVANSGLFRSTPESVIADDDYCTMRSID